MQRRVIAPLLAATAMFLTSAPVSAQLESGFQDEALISGAKSLRQTKGAEPANVAAYGYLKRYAFRADYEEVKTTLLEALERQELSLGGVTELADLLRPAGRDAASLYRRGELIDFCSARLLAQATAVSPHNVVFCPISVAIYVLESEPAVTQVSFRRPQAPGAPVRTQQALLALEAAVESAVAELVR